MKAVRGLVLSLFALCAPSSGAVFVFSERVSWRIVLGCALASLAALAFVLVVVSAVRALALPAPVPEKRPPAFFAAELVAAAEACVGPPPLDGAIALLHAVSRDIAPRAPRAAQHLLEGCGQPTIKRMRSFALLAMSDPLESLESQDFMLLDRLLGLLLRPSREAR